VVVNSLLVFIDRMRPKGFLVAATNLDRALDPAVWRRFDEVIWFDMPDRRRTEEFLAVKFRNVPKAFDVTARATSLAGYSFAEIERVCLQSIKSAIIEGRKQVTKADFDQALADEVRRRTGTARLSQPK
jgi:AAA+ superfamily predicted ATPase